MNEKQLFKSTWLKWGVILGVGSLVFVVIQGLLGVFGNQDGWSYLGVIINIAVVVLSFMAYKAQNNGYLKFGRSIGLAAMTGLIGGLIATVLVLGYVSLDDSMMDQLINNSAEKAIEGYEKQGIEMTEEEYREAMQSSAAQTFMFVIMGAAMLFFTVLTNVIVGLIAGAVMKNPPPEGHEIIEEFGNNS